MRVPQLLLKTLEDLGQEDFGTFKGHLSWNILDKCDPIPLSRLENASRMDTVTKMIQSYGEELAVTITVEILKMMKFNAIATELKNGYAGGNTATPATSSSAEAPPAAPASITAQHGSVIISPTLSGGTCGPWNVTINK